MAIDSMTGFARAAGTAGIHGWTWEIRSVNGQGLDLRVRVPPGFEILAEAARKRLAGAFSRGTLQVNLAVTSDAGPARPRVNEAVLAALLQAIERLPPAAGSSRPPRRPARHPRRRRGRRRGAGRSARRRRSGAGRVGGGLPCPDGCAASEGRALDAIVLGQLDTIARLAGAAERPGPQRRRDPRAPRRRRSRLLDGGPASIPTACTRRRSLLAARPISARRSTGCTPMSPPRASCWPRAGRSAASSISWPRSSTARPTRSAPRPMIVALTAHRPRTEDGRRSVPRAGPERGMSLDGRNRPSGAARPDPGPVVAVGRGEVDADPPALEISGRDESRPVDLGDDAPEAPRARSTACTTTSSIARPSTRMRDARRAARMGRGARQPLRHAARAGRERRSKPAATCSSTSTGRAPSRSSRRRARTSCRSSSCRPRWPS